MLSKFNSINSIVDYLREPIVPSTTKDSRNNTTVGLKMSKKQRKTKETANSTDTTHSPPRSQPQMLHNVNIEVLPKGRMRYGPITVNPRKLPSKTLFTGRRSKYEVLSTDEEERRRDRRERNRIAATKCREKRETVLGQLENQHQDELETHRNLLKTVHDLEQQKKYLENILNNHLNDCPLLNPSFSMIFGDTSFLSTIIDVPPPVLPPGPQPIVNSEDDELSHILDPSPGLTNSAYETDDSNQIFLPPLGGLSAQPITMTSSSIERLINSLNTPTISMESANNHSMLVNTAFGSTCAQQHSHSSDDDSLPSRANPCVY